MATAMETNRFRWISWQHRARLLGMGILTALLATGCNQAGSPEQAPKAVEVIVAQPVTEEVTDSQDFTGRLEAAESVEIRARVSGYVKEVPFKEGEQVKKGD